MFLSWFQFNSVILKNLSNSIQFNSNNFQKYPNSIQFDSQTLKNNCQFDLWIELSWVGHFLNWVAQLCIKDKALANGVISDKRFRLLQHISNARHASKFRVLGKKERIEKKITDCSNTFRLLGIYRTSNQLRKRIIYKGCFQVLSSKQIYQNKIYDCSV